MQRQKKKRDKLAAVLRENKRRLNQVKEEINVLTEPVEPGFSEMLENDVKRLRIECQAMLNEIENVRRCKFVCDPKLKLKIYSSKMFP